MVNNDRHPDLGYSLTNCFLLLFVCVRVSRFRVCQLVAKLLDNAAEESCTVGSQRMEKIQRAMLARLHDKVSEGFGG